MAMPNLSPTNYALKLLSKCEYCCDLGQSELNLSAYGFSIRGNIGNRWKYSEVTPPFGTGAISNPHKDIVEPYDLELVSELYATSSDINAFRNEVYETILYALHRAQTGIYDDTLITYPKHKYLEIGLWTGAAFQEYRLYVELTGFDVVPVWKTNMMVMQATIRFRVVDPIWYMRANGNYTWSVTNGGSGIPTGTQATSIASWRRVKRHIIKFLYLGTGDVINPTITNQRGETFTITGTLDTASQYWLVDMIEGRCYEGTSYSDQVDVTGAKFSGDFIGADFATGDSLVVTSPTDAGAITYNAYMEYSQTEM